VNVSSEDCAVLSALWQPLFGAMLYRGSVFLDGPNRSFYLNGLHFVATVLRHAEK